MVSNIKREVGVSRPVVVLNQGGYDLRLVSLLDDHLLTSFFLQLLEAFDYLFLDLWCDKHVIFLKLFLVLLVLVLIQIPVLNLVVVRLGELSALPDFLYRVVLLL